MYADLNIPKTKSMNIFFNCLTSHFIVFVVALSAKPQKQVACSHQSAAYIKLYYILAAIMCIVNIVEIFISWCCKQFLKIVFFIILAINLIIFQTYIFKSVSMGQIKKECPQTIVVQRVTFANSIIITISIILIIFLKLQFTQKFFNCGGRILWSYLSFIQKNNCSASYDQVFLGVGILHLIFVTSMIIMLAMFYYFTQNTKATITIWKISQIIGIIIFFILIIVQFITLFSDQYTFICQLEKQSAALYVKIGIIDIVTAILLLIFLRNEKGDVKRDEILDQPQNIADQMKEQINKPEIFDLSKMGTIHKN